MRVREQPQPFDPSQPLAHAKHEAFARELAKFKSYEDAARAAGYVPGKSFKANAQRLSNYQTIRSRVEYLQKVSGVAVAADSAFVQRKLLEMIEAGYSRDDIKPSDQLKALDMICKVNGLFAPQKIAPTNPEGTAPYEAITDEQRVKALEAFLAKVKGKGKVGSQ